MAYTKIAAKNISWVSASRFSNRGLAFIRTAILARILTPSQYGDFGIAALVLAFIEMLTETGINVFLIQHENDQALNDYLDTAYYISILRGLIIGTLVAILALPIGKFYNSNTGILLIFATSFIPIVRGFINPAIVTFQKQLQFKSEFFFRNAISIADAVIAVTIALIFKHPIALIGGLLAGAVVEVILSHRIFPQKPKVDFHPEKAKQILHSGKWVTLAGVAAYFSSNLPDLSIGKLMAKADLGFYQMGYKFSVTFIDELTEMVNRVMFPVYSQIHQDKSRLLKAFLKTHILFSLSGILLMMSLYFLSPVITTIFLGNNWLSIIPIIRSLTLVGVAIALAAPTNPILLALKAQKQLSYTVLIQLISLIILMGLNYQHLDLITIIHAYAYSIFISIIPRLIFTIKLFL